MVHRLLHYQRPPQKESRKLETHGTDCRQLEKCTFQIVWLFCTLFRKFYWTLLLVSSSGIFLLGNFVDHCVFYVLQLVWESSRYARLYERISNQFLWFIDIWKWSNLANLDSSRYFLEMCWKCLLPGLNELSCSVRYFSSPQNLIDVLMRFPPR